jgi:hypothetical protein
MTYKSPFLPFTQKIPSNEPYTEFLLEILSKLLEEDSLSLNKEEKQKLDEILEASFNQVEELDIIEENIPLFLSDPIF